MSEMIPFDFHGWQVYAVLIDGEPWFDTKGVCDALSVGRSNVSRHVEDDQKGSYSVRTPGGDQRVSVVSESGLYMLVFASRKPEAHQFRQWVARDVLPKLRQYGEYKPDSGQPVPFEPRELNTWTWEETATMLRQRYGMDIEVPQLRRLLRDAGVLKHTGTPRKKWRHLFWFTAGVHTVHPVSLPVIAQHVSETGAELRSHVAQLQLPYSGQRDE